jgi:tetratricopeptide (TPR) repeat protein
VKNNWGKKLEQIALQQLPKVGDRIGNYVLSREIGRGGMALIFEAERPGIPSRALKIMSNVQKEEEVVQRFHQEFRALSRIDHPNIVRVYESGIHSGRPYFVMDYIKGKVLKEEISSWRDTSPALRFSMAEEILKQLATALDFVHQRGLIHRDVTPSNIMLVSQEGRTVDVKLMDFGVVKMPGQDLTMVGEMVGTVAYMSPEQIIGEQIDNRTDLYSLGGVLYYMLTGKKPFYSRTLTGYLNQHLNKAPVPPHTHDPMIPKHLEQICLRLLAKDPDERFSSANHLLTFLGCPPADPLFGPKLRIVGRGPERTRIQEGIAGLDAGEGSVASFEGEWGMGCTTLLREAVSLGREAGIPCAFCQNLDPKQPAFYGIRPLYKVLLGAGTAPKLLQSIFNDDDSDFEKWPVFAAFKEILEDASPMIVAIDNLHRADQGTIELVEYLVRNLLPSAPVFFVLSTHGFGESGKIEGIIKGSSTNVEAVRIGLGPIPVSAVEEMILLCAEYSESLPILARRLHKEAEGNPTLIYQMLHAIADQGIVSKNRWEELNTTAEEVGTAPIPLPSSLRENATNRMMQLDGECRIVASLLAIGRQAISADLLCDAAARLPETHRLGREKALEALDQLRRHGFLAESASTGQYQLKHFWMQDLFLSEVAQEAQIRCHSAIGRSIENKYGSMSIVEELAYHCEKGLLYGKAYAYLFQAAQKLEARTLFKESLDYLNRAHAIEPRAREHLTLADAERKLATLLLEKACVTRMLGHQAIAREYAEAAEMHVTEATPYDLIARIATEKAKQARERYDLDETEAQVARALECAERAGAPRLKVRPLYEAGAMDWERGNIEKSRETLQAALRTSKEFEVKEGLALVSNGLGVIAMCTGQSTEARSLFEQAIQAGKENGMVEHLVNSRTNYAELCHCTGNFRKGLQLANEGITGAQEVHYRAGVGVGLRHRAVLLCDIGRTAEAKETAMASAKLHREMGNSQELLASIVCLVRAKRLAGEIEGLPELMDEALSLAENYDAEGYCPIVLAWKSQYLAHQGSVNMALELVREATEEEGRPWQHQKVRCLLNVARAWLGLREKALAMEMAQEALAISERSGHRYYTLLARRLLGSLCREVSERSRHLRIAASLARSLSANLSSTDAESFMARFGMPK